MSVNRVRRSSIGVGLESGAALAALAFLVPTVRDKQVVDLINFDVHDAPPLFNPDATGPIDVGGLALTSPQDGALFNDIFDAVFNGDTGDSANAATLFGDLFSL